MSSDFDSIFNKLKAHETSNVNARRSFGNDYLLKLKPGNTYTFRLLWLPAANGFDREYPMINQYVHRHWNNNATSKRLDQVYCPTSQYIMGSGADAWNACPICKECGRLYKQYDTEKSQSAYDMWKEFHRTLVGYIPVYVVSSSDETVSGIKILTYGKQMKEFFDRKIFGVVNNKKATEDDNIAISEDEVVGLDALMYIKGNDVKTSGSNFIVSVSTKKMPINGKQVDMPQYSMDFSRKNTNIGTFNVNGDTVAVTAEYLTGLSEAINFDNDYYKKSSDAELQEFYTKYLVASDESFDDIVDDEPVKAVREKNVMNIANTKPVLTEDIDDLTNDTSDGDSELAEDTSDTTQSNSAGDDLDLDALIKGL